MVDKYDEIKEIILNADGVDFTNFGEGVSVEWIDKAEARLGFKLPPSYIWWLKNYGGGEIFGQELFNIYEQDFDSVIGGDIVYMYELNVRNGSYSKEQLVVCESDDVAYYFDLTQKDQNGEMPIFEDNTKEKVAADFIELLKKMIQE